MNAERLLAHYEKIADAPDAISRLRRFILDLAVRGKLVPQDPNDEPASELLKRIAKEKLDQAGLPQGWRRVKIGSILEFQYGKGLKATERSEEGPVPVFGSNGIVGFTNEPLTVRPAIIVGRKGSAGALNLCDGPSWTTDVAYFVEAPSFLDLRFMLNALAALDLDKLGKGVKPGLSRSEAYDQIIAVPPLAEQRRIVAKLNELMALIDRLEAARVAREAARDKLTAASLARLNAPDPETFHDDARFALDALPALTARADQVKQFRQTILNLAVRGKLVPQDPNDEPASEVQARLAATYLKNKGEFGRRGKRPVIAAGLIEEPPYEIPSNWAWARMGELGETNIGLTYSPADVSDEGYPVLRSNNIQGGRIELSDLVRVRARPKDSVLVQRGDMLICARNGSRALVGKAALIEELPEAMAFGAFMAIFRSPINSYLHLFISSPVFRQVIDEVSTTTINQITQANLRSTLVPLPPLAEQRRIVAKVDELMALCDRLEASLASADESRRRLLEALLAEALAPADARELEAAE